MSGKSEKRPQSDSTASPAPRWLAPGIRLMLLVWLLLVPLAAKLTYTLSFKERSAHYVLVNLEIDGLRSREQLEFKMPVWTPGSYKVRDFSRHVVDLRITSGSRELPVFKLDKNTWQVELDGHRRIDVKYKVYAFEKDHRTSFVDADRALLNGASVFLYPVGMETKESLVVVDLPPGWQLATSSLPSVGRRSPVFRAPNYDTLIDSPLMIGSHKVFETLVDEVPYRYAISGQGEYDQVQLLADTRKIAGEIHQLFGSVPYDQYTIFLDIGARRNGALEHLNSVYLMVSRWTFEGEDNYRKYLEVLAHELFHAYNVKRIRPTVLGPFDYDRENYTTQLWVAEGLTSYYDRRLLLRSGLLDVEKYLELLTTDMEKMLGTPGRHQQTLEEASFDAWIKYYQPDENSRNATISYYTKGSLVGVTLDLAIREATDGSRSLDDVFRALWHDFQTTGEGFTPERFREICEETAGRSLEEVFAYVTTTTDIDWEGAFRPFGLEVVAAHPDPADTAKAYWGFETEEREGSLVITAITHDTPAAESRLSVNDELLFVDNYRLTAANGATILDSREQGETATFVVNRDGLMRTFRVKPVRPPFDSLTLMKVAEPTARQKMLYANWLGAAWE